ncbi:MAG: P-loop NTPase fold protein [Microthrixaceae bacterium]
MAGQPEAEQRSELIDDREVKTEGADKFRHGDVAYELAKLSATVETPANVALYGPWGSGKTGIANLLREHFDGSVFAKEPRIQFARFDAFKYAEIPLRRHFLSQMAVELLPAKEAETFRTDLYHSQTSTELRFTKVTVQRAVAVFAGILASGLVLAVLISAIVAGVYSLVADENPTEFWNRFGTYFSGVIGFSFAPAAVLGGLFAIAGKSLPMTRSRDIPSTDEEFERQFCELVDRADAKRLVVFVDELDRCPADRVVDVLDTVRTFLDVKGTVFIVAADQHVLEQALSKQVRQTTPSDTANPYYSSGSAYLDKVFHYQMSLPPLLPARVSHYAIELVDGREGVWTDARVNVPWTISVLIPTHVRSPRRVKTLLNNFVLTYRMATKRWEEGHLSAHPADRALELAKLVTLRTEFPDFARGLTISRRLPELFLLLAADPRAPKPPEVSDQVWNVAQRFALGGTAVDTMLDDKSRDSESDQPSEPTTADDLDEAASRNPSATLRQQLQHYLMKTSDFAISRDLIFFEGQGNLFDLDESLAEELENAAVEGRAEDVVATVDEQDPETQSRIIRLLSQFTYEAFPGINGENLVGVLLSVAAGRSDKVLTDCADQAIGAVNAHSARTELRPQHLGGAFMLGLRSDRQGADDLVKQVLRTKEAFTGNLGDQIVRSGDRLMPQHRERLGAIVGTRLIVGAAPSTADAVESLSSGSDIMAEAQLQIVRTLSNAVNDDKKRAEEGEDEALVSEAVDALKVAFDHCVSSGSHVVVAGLLRAALATPDQRYWTAADTAVRRLSVDRIPDDVKAMLIKRVRVFDPETLQAWFEKLPDDFGTTDDRREGLESAVRMLWRQREELGNGYAEHEPDFLAAMRQVARVQDDEWVRTSASDAIHDDVCSTATTNSTVAASVAGTWGHARRFAEEHLVDAQPIADAIAELVSQAMATDPSPPVQNNADAFLSFVRTWSLWSATECSEDAGVALTDAIRNSPWLPTPQQEDLALRVAGRLRARFHSIPAPYTDTEVSDLGTAHLVTVKNGVSAWIKHFARTGTELHAAAKPYLDGGRYSVVADAVRTCASDLKPDEREALALAEIRGSEKRRINLDFLRDVRWHEVDDNGGASALVKEYERSGNRNDRRRDLLDVWNVLGVTSPTALTKLIDGIALPMLSDGGKEALTHFRSRLDLVRDTSNRKTKLKEAMRATVGGQGKDPGLEIAMKDAGLVPMRKKPGIKGFIGQEEEVEDDDS